MFTHLILTISWPVVFIVFVYACVFKNVNKLRLQYEGTPKYLGESVTGMEKGLEKRQKGSELP